MDRFVKNVLLLCFSLSFLILCLAYIGAVLLGQQFVGTEEQVQGVAAPLSETPTSLTAISHQVEPVLYGVIGAVGGFISGFFYVDVFYKGANSHD